MRLTTMLCLWLLTGCISVEPAPAVVTDIHQRALEQFRYTPDPPGEQVLNFRGLDHLTRGDCEDFARLAQVMLREAGLPGGIIMDYDAWPAGHAVAYTVVDDQVWILDNESRRPIAGGVLPRFDDVPIDFGDD